LTELHFGDGFNKPLKPGVLPDGLIKIRLGQSFNQLLNPIVLPNKLTELYFGSSFNQPLKRNVYYQTESIQDAKAEKTN
jgi:hypothetical protein